MGTLSPQHAIFAYGQTRAAVLSELERRIQVLARAPAPPAGAVRLDPSSHMATLVAARSYLLGPKPPLWLRSLGILAGTLLVEEAFAVFDLPAGRSLFDSVDTALIGVATAWVFSYFLAWLPFSRANWLCTRCARELAAAAPQTSAVSQ